MNVLNYINSKDTRAHLERIGYRLAPLDAAKIIERCDHIDLSEKQEAFLQLIEQTEDVTVLPPEDHICDKRPTTLHTLLKSYIEEQMKAVTHFKKIEQGYVYLAERDDDPFPVNCTDFKKELLYFLQSDSKGNICFTKKNISSGSETSVGYDKKGRLLWVHDLERFIIPYNFLRLDNSFSEMIPSPFDIGDIVIACGKYKTAPFVITKMDENCICGYSLHNGRLINSICYNTAADIEFCPEKEVPALKALSDYIKGLTELDTFVNTYHKAALEEYLKAL